MNFARLVERGNRQILLTVGLDVESQDYTVTFETHYAGEAVISITAGGYSTFERAQAAMGKLSDDEVVSYISGLVDTISEDDPDVQ